MKKTLWIIAVVLLVLIQFIALYYAYGDTTVVRKWLHILNGFGQNESVSYQFIVHVSSNLRYWFFYPFVCVLYMGFIIFFKPKRLFLHQFICAVLAFAGICLLVVLPYWGIMALGEIV